MAGQHRARSIVRSGGAVLAVIAAAATAFVFAGSTANAAAALNSACDSRAVGLNAPTPLNVAYANPASSPCVPDQVALAQTNLTVIPGIPLVSAVTASVAAVKSVTSYGVIPNALTTEAQTDVARLQVTGPGLFLSVTGIHSQSGVNLNAECGGAASGESWVASLTLNGKVIPIGNQPVTLNVGLRIVISLNQTIHPSSHEVTQRALSITFPDKRYSLVVGESHAALSCAT